MPPSMKTAARRSHQKKTCRNLNKTLIIPDLHTHVFCFFWISLENSQQWFFSIFPQLRLRAHPEKTERRVAAVVSLCIVIKIKENVCSSLLRVLQSLRNAGRCCNEMVGLLDGWLDEQRARKRKPSLTAGEVWRSLPKIERKKRPFAVFLMGFQFFLGLIGNSRVFCSRVRYIFFWVRHWSAAAQRIFNWSGVLNEYAK